MLQNSLYSSNALVYDALSSDRDFRLELESLGVSRPGSGNGAILELFAGPAYHGLSLTQMEWDGEIFAIDSSPQMRDIAVLKGFPSDKYIVEDVCEAFKLLPTDTLFSTVLVMRWSLGLIPPVKAEKLVELICKRMQPGGHAFFELHRIDLLVGGLSDLDIRTRHATIDDSHVTCTWPSGKLLWARDEWKVEMPILISMKHADNIEEIVTSSEEWVYVRRDFQRWTEKLPVKVNQLFSKNGRFPDSNMICLQRTR